MKSNRSGTLMDVPSINNGKFNKLGYTWSDFLAEYQLTFIEVAYICTKSGKKIYYVRVGKFKNNQQFTIKDQLKGYGNTIQPRVGFGCRKEQKALISSLAEVDFSVPLLPSPSETTSVEETSVPTSVHHAESTGAPSRQSNINMLLQVHFFDRVTKPGIDMSSLWDMIDVDKISDGLERLVKAVQNYKTEKHQDKLLAIGEMEEELQFTNGTNEDSFPALKELNIPLKYSTISALQRDILKLSNCCCNANLLSFKFNNGTPCNLVQVPTSATYNQFKRNINRVKWFDDVLLAVAKSGSQEEAAEWIARFVGEYNHDAFVSAASSIGIIVQSKVMDAHSACAMWEEANVPVRAQRVIVRHLKNFFGRRVSVPEKAIRELEDGVLHPISDSVVVDKEMITFWYRNIDEVVLHRLKTEFKFRGKEYFQQFGFNSIDIVFGADHGARRFRAAIKVIFRNKENTTVSPFSVVITVGNIYCSKESREILEKTIAKPINESLKRIVNKFFIVYCQADQFISTIADEAATADDPSRSDTFCFSTRTFIAGDLAFFSLILGKENRSSKWCNWCMLSPKEWSVSGHERGELWTIDKIYDIRQQVSDGTLTEAPQNIKGCTEKPLIDAVPVENFILSILHIVIGVGNTFVDAFLEWVEERIEQLHPDEVAARNKSLFAQIQFDNAKKDHENWSQNEGIFLNDLILEKKELQRKVNERVCSS